MTHTPGPWQAEDLAIDAAPNERPWVGRLVESHYSAMACGVTQTEAIANARLIAAAPELLEALQVVVAILRHNPDASEPPRYRNARCARIAAAAIAKATGK